MDQTRTIRPDLADRINGASNTEQTRLLPERPLVRIRASQGRVNLNLWDLWNYRELLYFLMLRDIKVRYKQAVLGVAWAVVQPFLTMIIFALLFGKLVGIPSDNMPYPLFAYAGLLLWTFFSNAISSSSNSLVGNANLITKVYFPRMIIPDAAVAAGLVDLGVGFVLLIGMMVHYGFTLTWSVLLIPVPVGLVILLAIAVGMWMSALNVKYRDVRYAVPFLLQLWMFASPIVYPSSIVPPKWQWLLFLNPLTTMIESFRAALLGRQLDWTGMGVSAMITCVLLVCSAYAFKRLEKTFADLV